MSLIPATRGKFGRHNYFLIRIKAKELTERFILPEKYDGFEELSIQARWQRELNVNRVKKTIAPYLVNNENRFFGAFICFIENSEDPFTSINKIASIKKEYSDFFDFNLDDMGFVKLNGGEVLVPIDGQHRFAALKMAIEGKYEGETLPCGSNSDVANDDCVVILIQKTKEETSAVRNVFNKLNQYAKPTSASENYVTDDDNIRAVLAREMCELFTDHLVTFSGTNLTKKSHEFTTLPTIVEIVDTIIQHNFNENPPKDKLPEDDKIGLYRTECSSFLEKLITDIKIYSDALKDPFDEIGDKRRKKLRDEFIIMKPVVQLALVKAILNLATPKTENGSSMPIETIYERINETDWSPSCEDWKGIIIKHTGAIMYKGAVPLASRYISYMLGEKLDVSEKEELKNQILKKFDVDLRPPLYG